MKALFVTRDRAIRIQNVPEMKCRPYETYVTIMYADPLEMYTVSEPKPFMDIEKRIYQFSCRDMINGIPIAVFVEQSSRYPDHQPYSQNAKRLIQKLLQAGTV